MSSPKQKRQPSEYNLFVKKFINGIKKDDKDAYQRTTPVDRIRLAADAWRQTHPCPSKKQSKSPKRSKSPKKCSKAKTQSCDEKGYKCAINPDSGRGNCVTSGCTVRRKGECEQLDKECRVSKTGKAMCVQSDEERKKKRNAYARKRYAKLHGKKSPARSRSCSPSRGRRSREDDGLSSESDSD